MSNRIIELHDSEIAVIFYWTDDAILIFSHAYIHQSDGVPGRDPSSGWSQRAELVIENANGIDVDMRWPQEIYKGSLHLGSETLENTIPIPLDYRGDITIKLLTSDNNNLFSNVEL